MQKAFDGVPGVVEVTAGYAGGTLSPIRTTSRRNRQDRLRRVGAGDLRAGPGSRTTGCSDIYWHHIDPTTVNRAFCDTGPQYRSIIFYRDSAQQRAAEASKQALDRSHRFSTPVVTEPSSGPRSSTPRRSTTSSSTRRTPSGIGPT